MKNGWKSQPAPQYKYKKSVFERTIATASFVYQIGEYEALRKPSAYVPIITITSVEFQKKINYLKSSLKKYRDLTGYGRGITGVQIGIPERLSVIYMPEQIQKFLVIINPKVTRSSSTKLLYPEMCMSASPLIAPTTRPSWIEFEYCDEKGKRQYWSEKADSAEGMMYNRVLQHEIDHMHGIINIDLVQSKELIFESDPKFYDQTTFREVHGNKRRPKAKAVLSKKRRTKTASKAKKRTKTTKRSAIQKARKRKS